MRKIGSAVAVLSVLLLVVVCSRVDAAMLWKEFGQGNHYPDFSQKQANWGVGPGPGQNGWQWTFCGPTNAANCLWYFDHALQYNATGSVADWSKGAGYLVPAGTTAPQFIGTLSTWVHCDGRTDPNLQNSAHGGPGAYTGSYVDDMVSGINGYLAANAGGAHGYSAYQLNQPTFNNIVTECQNGSDVVLLEGFYEFQDGVWHRRGGHFMTVTGYDGPGKQIAISDSCKDTSEAIIPPPGAPLVLGNSHIHNNAINDIAHNDGFSVSRDVYIVSVNGDETYLTGAGAWETNYFMDSDTILNFQNQNLRPDGETTTAPLGPGPQNGDWATEIEYAVVVNPEPGTLMLLATGVLGLAGTLRRRRLS